MNILQEYKELFEAELDQIINLMKESSTIEQRLYFFSASFGTINRIMNFDCNPLLIFSHQELQNVHQNISNRLSQHITPSNMSFMGVPQEFGDALLQYLIEYKDAFSSGDDSRIYSVLEKFSNLSYAATGNGFYLYVRGRLKL
jgi:hypothetical protein